MILVIVLTCTLHSYYTTMAGTSSFLDILSVYISIAEDPKSDSTDPDPTLH